MRINPMGLDITTSCVVLGGVNGGFCFGGGVVTGGTTTAATPVCIAGDIAAGGAGERFIKGYVAGLKIWSGTKRFFNNIA